MEAFIFTVIAGEKADAEHRISTALHGLERIVNDAEPRRAQLSSRFRGIARNPSISDRIPKAKRMRGGEIAVSRCRTGTLAWFHMDGTRLAGL